MRFFNVYQYLGPAILVPLTYWLWLERGGGSHAFALLVVAIPVLYAYIVPAVGTNRLHIWEFNTRFRLGRFRPHHGFVFGSATSLIALVSLSSQSEPGIAETLRAAFVLGSVLAFWNWLYDVAALRAGFLRVYTRSYADGLGPEAIVTDYAPPIFGVFGVCYGACIRIAEHGVPAIGTWEYWMLLVAMAALSIAVPVAAYVAWSYARTGTSGLSSYERLERT